MNSEYTDEWKGQERRNGNERRSCGGAPCFSHSGMDERLKSNEKKIDLIEKMNFVPFANFKWALGILASVLVSLFSISIYLSINTNDRLGGISSRQETTIYKITVVQKDIETLKKTSSDELKEIKQKIHQHTP